MEDNPMTRRYTPEQEAEIRELARSFLPDPPPPPKPKPNLVVASEAELSLATQRERFDRVCERLMLAERRCIKEWRKEAQELDTLRREREAFAHQQRIDAWVETQRRIEAHERMMERYLDPTNSGIYGAAPCHRNRGED
jgi:hypothetical protein